MNVLTTATRALIALGFVALAGQAAATNTGSTDIYGNTFRQSFGVPTAAKDPVGLGGRWDGSTDLWSNGFSQSFGPGQAAAGLPTVCGTGSTDIWGNGFAQSFGLAPSSALTLAGGLCEVAAR
jgi:hypothetical protein